MAVGSPLELLYANAEERPDATAIVYADERLDFGELVDRVDRLSSGLAGHGVAAGDPVALVMRGDPWFALCFHAVTALGAVAVPVNPSFKPSEITTYFRDAGVRFAIGDERTADACLRLAAASERRIDVLTTAAEHDRATPLQPLLDATASDRPPPRHSDEPYVFQFSSGSTGRPKRMARTHGQCAAEARLYAQLGFTPQDTVFGALPLFHNWGLGSCLFAQAACGTKVAILEDPNPFPLRRGRALELIERERATIFPGVPFNFRLLASAPDDADLSSLRLCLSAGSGLPRSAFDAFRERFGVPVRQLYGTTETGMVAANMSADPVATFESVGRPVGEVRVEVVDDAGEPLPADEEGEVTVASPAMTSGYAGAGMEEQNRAAFRDGRYFTGDLGRLDADGLLYLTGRRKLLIEVGGYKVDPVEVEDVLTAHPQVAEAVVVGVPGEVPGEETLKAAVVRSGKVADQELTAFCRERLANFKIPRVIEFREEIPRSPLGKVLRKYLISDESGPR